MVVGIDYCNSVDYKSLYWSGGLLCSMRIVSSEQYMHVA